MHWPQASAIERVDSRDAIVILRDGSGLNCADFTSEALDDLLRASLVYGVSALDRYVHERVIKGFVSAYRAAELTKQQREFQVPVTLSMAVIDRVRAAQRENRAVRPANEVRKAVQETLHKRPFQNWREIEYAFCLLGYKNLARTLRDTHGLSVEECEAIQEQLNKIARRRNHIVHEGDLARHQRGGQVRPRDITPKFVTESLDFIDDLVSKLEAV